MAGPASDTSAGTKQQADIGASSTLPRKRKITLHGYCRKRINDTAAAKFLRDQGIRVNGLIVSFVAWVVRKGRRPKVAPITRQQFAQLFQTLDDKLYSGQLHRDAVGAFLADDISPAYPFIYGGTGETCTAPHGYSRIVKEIVVSQNQSNDAIVQGLLTEMKQAAGHLKELYQALHSITEQNAEAFYGLERLLKRPDSELQPADIAKLPKLK